MLNNFIAIKTAITNTIHRQNNILFAGQLVWSFFFDFVFELVGELEWFRNLINIFGLAFIAIDVVYLIFLFGDILSINNIFDSAP